MSNPVKSIAKGVRKVFKKVLTPKVIKTVLIGAAIYATGGALGLWGPGAASASTAATTATGMGSSGIPLASAGTTAGSTVGAGTVLAPTVAAAPTAATYGGVMAQNAVQNALAGTVATNSGAAGMGALAKFAGSAPTQEVAKQSLLSQFAGKAKSGMEWAQDNPIPSLMLAQGVQSALSPSEKELMKYRSDLDKDYDQYSRRNMNVAGIQHGETYQGPLSRFLQ